MKSYTDIEQGKKLAEILPIESADMCYGIDDDTLKYNNLPWLIPYHTYTAKEFYIPCWSLAALLSVIPQEIFDSEYIINITEGRDNRWVLTYDHYENRNHSYYGLSTSADNLIDACYETILKLHELNLL
jgi:hypothetical protein